MWKKNIHKDVMNNSSLQWRENMGKPTTCSDSQNTENPLGEY